VERLSKYDDFMAALNVDDPEAKKLRTIAKKPNFGTIYGISARGMAVDLITSEKNAQKFIDAYLAAFPGVEEWMEDVKREFRETGRSYTRLGAVRHLDVAALANEKWAIKRGERQAVNYRIQGSAGEQTKLGMSRFWLSDIIYDNGCKFMFPLHDETVNSTPKGSIDIVNQEVIGCLTEKYADMELDMTCDWAYGPNFGKLK